MSNTAKTNFDDFESDSIHAWRLPECIKYLWKWTNEDKPDRFAGRLSAMICEFGRSRTTIPKISNALDRLYHPGTPPLRIAGFEAANAHMLCLRVATQFLQDVLKTADPIQLHRAFGADFETYTAELSRSPHLFEENWSNVKAAMSRYSQFQEGADRDLKAQLERERTELGRQVEGSEIVASKVRPVLDVPDWADHANANSALARAEANARRDFESRKRAAQIEAEEISRRERLEAGWGKIYVPIGRLTDAPINYGQWRSNILAFCAIVKRERFVEEFHSEAAQDDVERTAVALLEAGLNGGEPDVASLLAELSEQGDIEWMRVFNSDALFCRLFAAVSPCPQCGGLRLPNEHDRLCAACREWGEMFRFTAAVKTASQVEEANIPNAAKLKQVACELFGHEGFTAYYQSDPTEAERSTTLARLEEWLDAKFQERGETRHEARERWLGMSTGDIIALLQNEMDRRRQDDLLRCAGEQHLHELLAAKTAVEQPHPDELALRQWLANERVEDKFVPGWHQRIADAQAWRVLIPPVWHLIAACLDELFPGTSNTFNAVSSRGHVQEPELFAYLLKKHGLAESESRALTLTKLAQLLQDDVQAKKTRHAPDVILESGPEASKANSLTAKKQKRSTERGKGRGDERAALRLLSVFTDGLADERLDKAANVLEDDSLTVDEKLWKIDTLIPIPPTVAAAKLGEALGVSKTAIQKSTWYSQKRKGQKDNEIGRRHEQHRQHGQQFEPDRVSNDDD